MVGGQAMQAGSDTVTTGQDADILGAGGQPAKEGWWIRLRKRGAVAAVAGVVVAILAAAGWKP